MVVLSIVGKKRSGMRCAAALGFRVNHQPGGG